MTLLNEAAETDQGLEDYLAADATLTSLTNGIFSTFIGTTSTPMPIVRFTLIESDDLMVINGTRVWSELVYQVEAITDGPESTDAAAIAQRIDQLLHALRGRTWGSVLVEEVYRRQPLFRKEVEGGDPFCYCGGEYVFHVSAL